MINFFTYADEKYKHFIYPFIFCNHQIMPKGCSEILVDQNIVLEVLRDPLFLKLKTLGAAFWIFSRMETDKVIPNAVRFIESPGMKRKYTYICDIDIMHLDADFSTEINQMTVHKSCFSNVVRPDSKRLTGLHFVETDDYYGNINLCDLPAGHEFMNDEELLYYLVDKSFGPPQALACANRRPVHGVHLSPNRSPNGVPGWNYLAYKDKILELAKNKDWRDLFPLFDEKFQQVWMRLISLCIEDKRKE